MRCPKCNSGYQLKEGQSWFCGECEISYDEYGNRSDRENTVPTPEECEEMTSMDDRNQYPDSF